MVFFVIESWKPSLFLPILPKFFSRSFISAVRAPNCTIFARIIETTPFYRAVFLDFGRRFLEVFFAKETWKSILAFLTIFVIIIQFPLVGPSIAWIPHRSNNSFFSITVCFGYGQFSCFLSAKETWNSFFLVYFEDFYNRFKSLVEARTSPT